MHCVGEYPSPDDHLHLSQISLLKKRYPELEVGYSTHERPDNFEAVKIAIALGATLFEKHTAVSEEDFSKEPHRNKLNIVISRTSHLQYHTGQLVLLN